MKYIIGLIIVFSFKAFSKEISSDGLAELLRYQPLHDCYNKFLQAPGQSGQKIGKLVLDLKINSMGEVLTVKEVSKKSTLHEDVFNKCVFQALKDLKFPKEASGKEKELSLILDFPIKKLEQ